MRVLRGGKADRPGRRVGLVLGAGGLVGQAYQVGVLAALEREAGWDPREAAVIVGTSAGSITGTALRLGISATDLAASAYGTPRSTEGAALLRRILPNDERLPVPNLRSLFRPWHVPSPALLGRVARRPWTFRPDVALMTLLPSGLIDVSARARALHDFVGDRWPEELWLCASRCTDGERVVFGRPGGPPAALSEAVLASCAIPGYFRPITIDGVEYFDGGVHSVTNADVLEDQDLDTVVVVSSMSAVEGYPVGPDGLLRWGVHRRLAREVARLAARGTTVIRLEPGPSARRAMGFWAMAEGRAPRVVAAAYEEGRDRVLTGLCGPLGPRAVRGVAAG